ncbi:MAG: hypothetical protein KatS3mg002_0682 [Candidatus Woesearchaeota archaeon]|nr:MAG: hypothetical protein KatS3mg002_0682 [Candidatus Woesearchaeota archaeon]
MVDDDSDYQLVPRKEFEKLKKEVIQLKKNPYSESDTGRDLQQSIDRLNNTINKLISILEDAQQDIIDEYQESKPIEKLNQILDQNETIAKALVSINDKLSGEEDSNPLPIPDVGPVVVQTPQIPRPGSDSRGNNPQSKPFSPQGQPFNPQINGQINPNQMQQLNQQQRMSQQVFPQSQMMSQQVPPQIMPQQPQQPSQQFSSYQTQQPKPPSMQQFSPLPPLDSLDSLPPLEGLDSQQLDSGILPEKKKKFLGFIG